jgi:hypothetical protein
MLVANWIYMVDYVFYGKCFGILGALHTWLWLMEINVKRKETTCNYCTSFLPYLEVTTFTIPMLFLVSLVSIVSVFLRLWKNSGAHYLSGILLTCMLNLISPFMNCNYTSNKIIMLALRVCLQSVFSF